MDASGRVSTAAIKSELAKVYLTMAGQPLNKGATYYKLAADKAKEVIDYSAGNQASLGLFANYGALHDAKNDNKVEHLFGIQYNDAAGSGNPCSHLIYLCTSHWFLKLMELERLFQRPVFMARMRQEI